MPGPEEQRLIRALTGAESGKAFGLSGDWIKCSDVLTTVATRLRVAEMPIHGGDAGALTKEAMKTAFAKAAEALDKRVEHLGRGQTALLDAGDAIDTARTEYEKLGPESPAPSYTPHEDPGSEAGIKQRNAFLDELAAFNSQQQHRENVSKAQADRLDQVFTASAEVMQSIHGQKPDIPDPGGPGGGYPPGRPVGGGGGGGVSSGGGGGGGGVITAGVVREGGDGRAPDGPGVGYAPGQGDRPSSLDSPPSALVPSASGSAPGSAIGSGGGLGLGNTAALAAGAAGAGVIGAKLTGALRGALAGAAGGAAGRGTAASAVRGIGSSARAGGTGTLGRGAGAAPGRGGASGAGRFGQGGGAGAGSRVGAGTGTGAGGRGGRGGTDDARAQAHDEFDVAEDWVGDDDAAPGVIS